MIDPSIDTTFRSLAADRRYGSATLERWAALAPDDAAALLQLVRDLRPSENQLRDLWNWIDEIARRDQRTPAAVLTSEFAAKAWRRPLGRNDRLKLIKNALRRLRFPQLSAAEERLATLIGALGLPRQVRVVLPEFLEGDSVRIEITADSVTSLHAAATALSTAATTPACEQLFALLAEAE